MSADSLLADALLARLDGTPVCRCPECSTWQPASPLYVEDCCVFCRAWFDQWRRTSDGTWEVVT